MNENSQIVFKVSGKVQGVFFRKYTKHKALSLNLTGYAKNLPDGTVEVLAQGDQAHIEKLKQWLFQGSPLSRVASVEQVIRTDIDSEFESFYTL